VSLYVFNLFHGFSDSHSIYGIRYALTSYFDYRISNTTAYLKKLNKERDATIERLKDATKYNSTQQLLEKYGASPKQKEQAPSPGKNKSQGPQKPVQAPGPRTGIAPPPTANIQRAPTQPQGSSTPQRVLTNISSLENPSPPQQDSDSPGAEFAPNAFGSSAHALTNQFSAAPATTFTQTHWYDRILDALLGEDETQPKNRLALICSECRLVNGQAPPGANSLEDVGRWRCGGCKAWNGKEKTREDVEGLVKGWEEERRVKAKGSESSGREEKDEDEEDDGAVIVGADQDDEDEEVEEVVRETPPSRGTRSKTKGKGKK
jgi:hypothetical protein